MAAPVKVIEDKRSNYDQKVLDFYAKNIYFVDDMKEFIGKYRVDSFLAIFYILENRTKIEENDPTESFELYKKNLQEFCSKFQYYKYELSLNAPIRTAGYGEPLLDNNDIVSLLNLVVLERAEKNHVIDNGKTPAELAGKEFGKITTGGDVPVAPASAPCKP